MRGVAGAGAALDEQIAAASQHWRIERMARVDRNVLRLGTWELVHQADVPRAVILDEAVELAKAYGTDDSSAFVNGVLNKVADALGRKDEPRAATPLRSDGAALPAARAAPHGRAHAWSSARARCGATSARCAASRGCSTGAWGGG